MKEFIIELLQAVAAAAVPVCAAFLVQFLRRKSEEIGAQVDSLTTKELLAEVTEAVTTAVTYTSQTYVDALKNAGKFDAEAQEEFAKKALTACLQSISPAAQRFIESTYDGIREYLTTRIEAKMRKQKGDAALALSVPMLGELVSTVETTVKKTDLNVGAMRPETA